MMRLDRHGLCFLLPWIVGLVFWTLAPMVGVLALSLTHSDGTQRADRTQWVGLAHYRTALDIDTDYVTTTGDPWYWHMLGGRPRDPRLALALFNTLSYTCLAVPAEVLGALGVALLLRRRMPGIALARALVYLPHLLGGVAVIMIWSWLLNPQFGWVNEILRSLCATLDPIARLIWQDGSANWTPPAWLFSPTWCKPAVVLMHTWTMGGAFLIFLAALARIPKALYDATALDGAGTWSQFRNVTLPQIAPVILFNVIIALLFSMQSFNESYMLEHYSQQGGLLFYVRYLYEVAFEPPYAIGYASALSCMLLVVLLIVSIPMVLMGRRWVQYEVGA